MGVIIVASAIAFLISKRRQKKQPNIVVPAGIDSDPRSKLRELDNKPLARELHGEGSLPELASDYWGAKILGAYNVAGGAT